MPRPPSLLVLAGLLGTASCVPPSVGAGAITRPFRLQVAWDSSGKAHEDFSFQTRDGLTLRGWLWRPAGTPRGLVVFIHGINSNRMDGGQAARRLVQAGWAVLAHDNRAHGVSEGTHCTYGFHEKEDVWGAIAASGVEGPVVLIGHSLGAGIALQAGSDPRVRAVVAISPFADLDEIIRDTATPILAGSVPAAIEEAERQAAFHVQDVSPRRSAAKLTVPVLVIHGTADQIIPIKHSERISADARGVRFVRFPGAIHHDVLWREDVWRTIVRFVEEAVPNPSPTPRSPHAGDADAPAFGQSDRPACQAQPPGPGDAAVPAFGRTDRAQPPAPGGRLWSGLRPACQAQKNAAAEAITVRG